VVDGSLAVFKRPCPVKPRCGQLHCGWLRSGLRVALALNINSHLVRCNDKQQIGNNQTVQPLPNPPIKKLQS
jgi:hypothetical protein